MARISRFVATLALSASVLVLHGGTPVGAAPNGGESSGYVVKRGDSLYGIATKLGVPLPDLLAANGMIVSSTILAGQQLQVPGAAAPAVAATGGSYTIKAGDSLGGIASRHGVSLQALLATNGMTAKSLILPGQTITLPAGAAAPAAAPAAPAAPAGGAGSYVVQAGDSLGGIASRHGVSLPALLAANGMTANSLILPGQTIALPDGARLSTPTSAAPTGTAIDTVVSYALAQQGKPYQFFADGPESFDCSGLTKAAYAQIGVTLIHQSASQARQGRSVDFMNEPIQAGDLIFLITRDNQVINHVGMAINATQYVHAPAPNQPVRVGPIPSKDIIVAVRRYV